MSGTGLKKAPWSLQGMPVVQTGRGARQVVLLARSIDEYLHRHVPHLLNDTTLIAGLMRISAVKECDELNHLCILLHHSIRKCFLSRPACAPAHVKMSQELRSLSCMCW